MSVDAICEMLAVTNISSPQAAYYTHFRTHKIDSGETGVIIPAFDGELTDDDDNDADTIMDRLVQANMLMHAHFNAA